MLKVLIVDDEALTREGIKNSIDWRDLQIGTVLEASNGREGVRIAKEELPQVIITDVRMPQMTGVEMVEELRQVLPDTSIIFMSGYSDKDYLLAAIRFKAIRYVEKPLDLNELSEAIREAIGQYEQQLRLSHLANERESGKAGLGEKLAELLSHTVSHEYSSMSEACAGLGVSFASDCSFTSLILKFNVDPLNGPDTKRTMTRIEDCADSADSYLSRYDLKEVHVNKYDQYLIFFLYGTKHPDDTMMHIARKIHQIFSGEGDHFLSVGRSVSGVENAYNSYSSAVFLMQSSFFYERNSIITADDDDAGSLSGHDTAEYTAIFSELLSSKDSEGVDKFLDKVLSYFRNSHSLLPNQVKDDYYKLFIALQKAARTYQAVGSLSYESDNILDYLERAHTLFELHDMLREKTKEYFDSISAYKPENPTIFAIKEYISKNYMDSMLSVKTISDHVHRSTSYVCTVFKTETDETLNQYITEFRIEKAKSMLEDPCSKINDISFKVGYTDGNYFSKSFKKYVGLSPTEYREKML